MNSVPEADQYYPSVSANGNLYFRNSNKFPGFDLYYSKYENDQYTEPVKLKGQINTDRDEIDNCISPDESFIVFAGYGRKDSKSSGDLYISFKETDNWTEALNLGDSINSRAREYCPMLSPDGNYLFFTSTRGVFDGEIKVAYETYGIPLSLIQKWGRTCY